MNVGINTIPVALLLLASGWLTTDLTGQDKQLASWPVLEKIQRQRVQPLLRQLSKKPALVAKAQTDLGAMGAGVAPLLLRQLTKDTEARIIVLDRCLQVEHAELLAAFAKHKEVTVRRYVIGKLGQLRQPCSEPALRNGMSDKDGEVALQATFGLAALTADGKALEKLFQLCQTDWKKIEVQCTESLAVQRDAKHIPWIEKHFAEATDLEKVATLRMMRGLAPKEAANFAAIYLDAEASLVKKEVINTLRVIVDGDKPLSLDSLTVFNLIGKINKWKKRL